MKKVMLVMFVAMTLAALQSQAQKEDKKASFGFVFTGGIPLGDTKTSFNVTGGLDLRFSYKAGPGYATVSVGANGFIPKSFANVDTKAAIQIPVKVGYKYVIVPHLFAMGEVGFSSFRFYTDINGTLVSSNTSGFTYAPSIGTQFGAFEAAIRYEGVSVSGGSISFVALRLGFNF